MSVSPSERIDFRGTRRSAAEEHGMRTFAGVVAEETRSRPLSAVVEASARAEMARELRARQVAWIEKRFPQYAGTGCVDMLMVSAWMLRYAGFDVTPDRVLARFEHFHPDLVQPPQGASA